MHIFTDNSEECAADGTLNSSAESIYHDIEGKLKLYI